MRKNKSYKPKFSINLIFPPSLSLSHLFLSKNFLNVLEEIKVKYEFLKDFLRKLRNLSK